MRALLERKLDELPQPFRLVFLQRSVEEMSVEDTARCLGIPEATVTQPSLPGQEPVARIVGNGDRSRGARLGRV